MQLSAIEKVAQQSVSENVDEVDQLFEQLEQVAVPSNFMQQLRARLQQLPVDQRYAEAAQEQVTEVALYV